jgi:AcrR family transcriptional regulator
MLMSRGRSTGAKDGRYHHGDLRAALVDAAIALVAERGVRGFSLAEASRRLGVSAAAPYRHFADRDELLAAVAVRSLLVFAARAATEADGDAGPRQRLAAMTHAYVRFAAEERPLFDALYSAGLDKTRYPSLQDAWTAVDGYRAVVEQICAGTPVQLTPWPTPSSPRRTGMPRCSSTPATSTTAMQCGPRQIGRPPPRWRSSTAARRCSAAMLSVSQSGS